VLTAPVLILNSPGPYHVVIGSPSKEQYFEPVASHVAPVGAVSREAPLAFLEVTGGMARVYGYFGQFGTTMVCLSVFGFMGILPLILAAFHRWGATIVLLLEIGLPLAYFLGRRHPAPGDGVAAPPGASGGEPGGWAGRPLGERSREGEPGQSAQPVPEVVLPEVELLLDVTQRYHVETLAL
jgi:hypothetical protein